MQITTDDDVYRVDAVWLGPPRATFPWRARYSSYGVGLLVMIAVMFAQRRLGIDLGFFSVAWALLITVTVTRFVGRRINEDRPLLEWLTLFAHELRGPRRAERAVGSALDASHVRVRRDRPRVARGQAPAVALPRRAGAPAPADERVITPRVRAAGTETVPTPPSGFSSAHVTPGLDEGPPAHATRGERPRRRPRTRAAASDSGFGPPSTATVGEPGAPAALPPAAPRPDPAMAAWTTPPTRDREPVRVRARRVDAAAATPDDGPPATRGRPLGAGRPAPSGPRASAPGAPGAPGASGGSGPHAERALHSEGRPAPRSDRPRRDGGGPRRFGPGAPVPGEPTPSATPRGHHRGVAPVADDAPSRPGPGRVERNTSYPTPSAPQSRISPTDQEPGGPTDRADGADGVPGAFGPGSRRTGTRPHDEAGDPREGDGAAPQNPL